MDIGREYIILHGYLLEQVGHMLPAIDKSWRSRQEIDPFLVSWPEHAVLDDKGVHITRFVIAELGKDRSRWNELFMLTLKRTHPCGLLLVEQMDEEVVATFESRYGSRSWRYPIKDHGGVRVLGDPVTRDDVDSIGILWSKDEAEA